MGQYTDAAGRVVRFTDGETYRLAAALLAVIEGEYKGTDNVESRQAQGILGSLERNQPLDVDEWNTLTILQKKYSGALAALMAKSGWDGQDPVVPQGTGRILEAASLIPPSMRLREADGPASTGVMVALYPQADVAESLALDGGEDADDLHLTLVYLGPASMIQDGAKLRNVVGRWASGTAPLAGNVSGTGQFTNGPKPVTYASADVPGLSAVREDLVSALRSAGFPLPQDHGFQPHLTLDYSDRAADVENHSLLFDRAALVVGGEREDFPLSGLSARSSMRLARAALDFASLRMAESAPFDPPHLRDAQDPAECCATCRMYWRGKCGGYWNKPVREAQVCDSWVKASGGKAPAAT